MPSIVQEPLRKNDNYFLTGNPVYLSGKYVGGRNSSGVLATKKIVEIYLLATNAVAYKCAKCDYTRPTARGVLSHLRIHNKVDKSAEVVARKAAAFDMLPKKMQTSLLKRLDEQQKAAATPDDSDGTAEDA